MSFGDFFSTKAAIQRLLEFPVLYYTDGNYMESRTRTYSWGCHVIPGHYLDAGKTVLTGDTTSYMMYFENKGDMILISLYHIDHVGKYIRYI